VTTAKTAIVAANNETRLILVPSEARRCPDGAEVTSVATQNLAEEQLQPIGPRFSEPTGDHVAGPRDAFPHQAVLGPAVGVEYEISRRKAVDPAFHNL